MGAEHFSSVPKLILINNGEKMKLLIATLLTFCIIDVFPQKVGNAYALDINNIYLPLNSKGILAAVNIPPNGSGGQFAGNMFLFSGGFFLS